MSDRVWPYTAVVRIDGTTYRGCAESRARPNAADALEGNWRVVAHHEPGIAAMSSREADTWVGRKARFSRSLAQFGTDECSASSYEARSLTPQAFAQEFRVPSTALGLRAPIQIVEVPAAFGDALRDRYPIERHLGSGGTTTVYLARDLKHDRPVALKVLRRALAATLGPERFEREIRFTARLQHPHILTVLDSGEADGQLWFTMPYVRGESLRERLRREGHLPVEEALRITHETLQALAYAHSEGVVHRDVKPENLLRAQDGSTLVADFGIARALEGREDSLTQTGMAVGTPVYMSPEQAAGHPVDARSDLYSLACVCYEMLAGEPPYTGPTAQAIVAKRLNDPWPSVRRLRPTVPEAVNNALQRALAPLPADRFGSAPAFARALQTGSSTPAATRRAADRALRLAPDRPESYYALAYVRGSLDLDARGALETAQHARALAPNDVDVLSLLPEHRREQLSLDRRLAAGARAPASTRRVRGGPPGGPAVARMAPGGRRPACGRQDLSRFGRPAAGGAEGRPTGGSTGAGSPQHRLRLDEAARPGAGGVRAVAGAGASRAQHPCQTRLVGPAVHHRPALGRSRGRCLGGQPVA